MSIEVIIGIILILINVPFGWGGALICGYYGQKTGKKFFYVLSVLVYALSWVMLSVGVFLCGKPYAKYIIDNYVAKFIAPAVFFIVIAAIAVIFVYREKIFKKKKQ
jgi:hypothetical protein